MNTIKYFQAYTLVDIVFEFCHTAFAAEISQLCTEHIPFFMGLYHKFFKRGYKNYRLIYKCSVLAVTDLHRPYVAVVYTGLSAEYAESDRSLSRIIIAGDIQVYGDETYERQQPQTHCGNAVKYGSQHEPDH